LSTRARVAIAQGDPERGERDAHDALARAAEVGACLLIPDVLECLAEDLADRLAAISDRLQVSHLSIICSR
jgi:hypothetical protein